MLNLKLSAVRFFNLLYSFIILVLWVEILGGCTPKSTAHEEQSQKDSLIGVPDVTDSIMSLSIPDINIYVENSGSMYGYVGAKDGSDFRNMIYSYLSDVKLSGLTDSMHLHFVNSEINKCSPSLEDFIQKLTPNSFKITGGNSGATDIVEIIKRIYPSDGDMAILVSDFIISPGKRKDASEYLINQQSGLKIFVGEKSIEKTGVLIYRMLGQFKGTYYDKMDNKCFYDGIRPYYIWIFGDVVNLKKLRECVEPKMLIKPDQMCVISNGDPNLKYNVVNAGGNYRLDHQDRTTLSNLKKIKTKQGDRAVVKLSVDYSKMLHDDDYLTDTSNYEVSHPMFRIDNIIKKSNNQYVITLSSASVVKGEVCVRLKNRSPHWVDSCSDDEGGFPNPQAEQQTTFGLSYLIRGVYDAYTFRNDNLAEMKINIK